LLSNLSEGKCPTSAWREIAVDARCRIELFGGMRLVQHDRIIARFRTHKAAHLLAYLALYRDQSHARERLIQLFWPEAEMEAGRASLSNALSSLRRQDRARRASPPAACSFPTGRAYG
jgi:two-component SAPR family response regulator